MKYLKLFESYNDIQQKIIDALLENDDDVTLDEILNLDNCPFEEELLLLHEREYIDEIFWNSSVKGISLGEFKRVYNELLAEAPNKIIEKLKKKPELFLKYGEYVLNLGVDVPDWLVGASKYNL